MKKNYHKSCGNCLYFQKINQMRIRCKKTHCKTNHHCPASKIVAWHFGGLCELKDSRGGPQCGQSCKLWRGIKYDKWKERREIKRKLKLEIRNG